MLICLDLATTQDRPLSKMAMMTCLVVTSQEAASKHLLPKMTLTLSNPIFLLSTPPTM